MTLDEAIKHAEEVAEEKEKLANTYESFKDYGNPKSSITSGHEKCLRCAKEHRQLAEWLKELKQLREQQLCEDTISRQEAINKLTGKEFWLNYDYETLDQVITSMLNDLPPVTPQPKMGRWIRKTVKAGCFVFGCNQCGWQQLYATDFCPDCKARMFESQESEELGMIKEYEKNKANAEKLSTLMANHPDMRVIAWIDTDGINDDYCCVAGNIYEPHIETLIIGKDDMYHEKEDSPYDDCGHYYGWKEVDKWSDEEIEEKAKQIPWEDVIAVRVGVN